MKRTLSCSWYRPRPECPICVPGFKLHRSHDPDCHKATMMNRRYHICSCSSMLFGPLGRFSAIAMNPIEVLFSCWWSRALGVLVNERRTVERLGCERRMAFFKPLFHFQIADCNVVIEQILVLKNEVGEQLIKDLGDFFNVQAHRWRLSSLFVGTRRMLVPAVFRTSCSPY